MSRFILSFDTDNAAFEDDPFAEIARVLRATAEKVEDRNDMGTIRDLNGNTIGDWETVDG